MPRQHRPAASKEATLMTSDSSGDEAGSVPPPPVHRGADAAGRFATTAQTSQMGAAAARGGRGASAIMSGPGLRSRRQSEAGVAGSHRARPPMSARQSLGSSPGSVSLPSLTAPRGATAARGRTGRESAACVVSAARPDALSALQPCGCRGPLTLALPDVIAGPPQLTPQSATGVIDLSLDKPQWGARTASRWWLTWCQTLILAILLAVTLISLELLAVLGPVLRMWAERRI